MPQLLPEELWSVYALGPGSANKAKLLKGGQRQLKRPSGSGLDALEAEDEAADKPDAPEAPEEEELDDEYESEEDDMAGDYNA